MNRIFKFLLISGLIWAFAEGMLGPLFAIFTERIGGDILQVTWAWATYLIVLGIFTLLVSRWSDTRSKEKIMVAGYGINAIATFSYLFVSTPTHLFVVTIILGISAALANPTWQALYGIYAEKEKEATAWGYWEGYSSILEGLALIAGGIIVVWISFDALFITMGVIQIIATIVAARILVQKS